MSPLYCGLVHHPVRTRQGDVVTTAVTNLDVHDLARLTRTYDLQRYFVITPLTAQQALVARILDHWKHGAGNRRIPERGEALSQVAVVASIGDALAAIEGEHGTRPHLIATAAREHSHRRVAYSDERTRLMKANVPSLILFGTGHGLTDEVLDSADTVLPPIRGGGSYNHLSVRTAAAITIDRLLGD